MFGTDADDSAPAKIVFGTGANRDIDTGANPPQVLLILTQFAKTRSPLRQMHGAIGWPQPSSLKHASDGNEEMRRAHFSGNIPANKTLTYGNLEPASPEHSFTFRTTRTFLTEIQLAAAFLVGANRENAEQCE